MADLESIELIVNRLELELTALSNKYNSDIERMAVVAGKFEQLSSDVISLGLKYDEHDKFLIRGNGKPSLMEDVRTIKDFIKNIKFWITAVAIAFIGQFMILFFAVLVWAIQSMGV